MYCVDLQFSRHPDTSSILSAHQSLAKRQAQAHTTTRHSALKIKTTLQQAPFQSKNRYVPYPCAQPSHPPTRNPLHLPLSIQPTTRTAMARARTLRHHNRPARVATASQQITKKLSQTSTAPTHQNARAWTKHQPKSRRPREVKRQAPPAAVATAPSANDSQATKPIVLFT